MDEKVKVNVGYENLTAQEVLEQILPKDVVVPGGFETVGHVAHLNLN